MSRTLASTGASLAPSRAVGGRRLRAPLHRAAGFTLVEILVVLAILATLIAVIAPAVTSYVDDSQVQSARKDLRSVGDALTAHHATFGDYPIFRDGSDRSLTDANTFDILFGPGNLPELGSSISTSKWSPIGDGTLDSDESGDDADELSDQLLENEPGYPTTGKFRWTGPYLEDLSSDPWGRAYLVNAENLRPDQGEAGYVVSAGPNETLETDFEIDRTSGPITPGGDDELFRVR